jgi:hypothetical protein
MDHFVIAKPLRNVKCTCGELLPANTYQIKVFANATRYGVRFRFVCRVCATKEVVDLITSVRKLDKIVREQRVRI